MAHREAAFPIQNNTLDEAEPWPILPLQGMNSGIFDTEDRDPKQSTQDHPSQWRTVSLKVLMVTYLRNTVSEAWDKDNCAYFIVSLSIFYWMKIILFLLTSSLTQNLFR